MCRTCSAATATPFVLKPWPPKKNDGLATKTTPRIQKGTPPKTALQNQRIDSVQPTGLLESTHW